MHHFQLFRFSLSFPRLWLTPFPRETSDRLFLYWPIYPGVLVKTSGSIVLACGCVWEVFIIYSCKVPPPPYNPPSPPPHTHTHTFTHNLLLDARWKVFDLWVRTIQSTTTAMANSSQQRRKKGESRRKMWGLGLKLQRRKVSSKFCITKELYFS